MLALAALALFPLHARQVVLPEVPPSVWTFEDRGSAELARLLGSDLITVLAPDNPHAGYALYANGETVEVGRFNWYLLDIARQHPERDPNGLLAYTEGTLPPLADAIEWGLAVFDHYGIDRPTTSWEPGFPLESRDWTTWLLHLRSNLDDRFDPEVEAMVVGWLTSP